MGMTTPFMTVRLEVERMLKMHSLEDVADALWEWGLAQSAQEQLWVIALDSQNQVRSVTQVVVGTYHDCYVSVPQIFSPVLLSASDRFIIAHNHPNGRAIPTADDKELTARVQAAADVMAFDFDDHLIVTPTRGTWMSMRDAGHMKE